MNHWRQMFPGRVVTLDYERLVIEPAAEIERLIRAIGLTVPEGGLALDQRQHTVKTASNWQARQPVYQSSLHRWRQYAEQLEPIIDLASVIH